MKAIVIISLLVILWCLFSALFTLLKDKPDSTRTARSLTMRIGISIALFLFLLVAFHLGWLHPHALS
ncbi:MAG: membrane protein [marine bacterium B5-7]|nr:MAG: membrane protein [marine bacterium B5-7]